MFRIVSESISRMKDTEVVDVLDITFLEVELQREPLSEVVQCVQSLRLRFRDRWYVRRSR